MSIFPLISTDQLVDLLEHPGDFRLVDCRFDLANPGWGRENFLQAHIPGAIYADLNQDLSSAPSKNTGRHPLPDPEKFVDTLANWGIEPGRLVVAYDTTGASFADRFWWLLNAIGHENVQLLDGGFPKWQAEGHPIHSGLEPVASTSFHYRPVFNPEMYLTTLQILEIVNDPAWLLIDARSTERFQGLVEPIDPVAGHIPGAVNRIQSANLTSTGTFKPIERLRQEYAALIGSRPLDHVVVYCGSGVSSCHHLAALQAMGLSGVRLYVGSWSEWIRDPSRPIATGE